MKFWILDVSQNNPLSEMAAITLENDRLRVNSTKYLKDLIHR